VVGIDGSAAAKKALKWAVEEAELTPSNAITAVAVWRKPHLWEPLLSDPSRLSERSARHLDEAIDSIEGHASTLEATVAEGHVIEELLKAASAADVLVIANEHHEGGRFEHATIPVALSSHASCPVVVVP
jgi:nucleotide-binding universal stress UspA family protein